MPSEIHHFDAFSAFASHLQGLNEIYCNNRFFEFQGQINDFIGSSGAGKDQVYKIVEIICQSLRTHDQIEIQKIAAWQAKPKDDEIRGLFYPFIQLIKR